MPLVTIWIDPNAIGDDCVLRIRDVMHHSVASFLKVELNEVEVRVRYFGLFDLNFPRVGVEVDTGPGKRKIRLETKSELAKNIAMSLHVVIVLMENEGKIKDVGAHEPDYVWLRIFEHHRFVPVANPALAR